MNLFTQQTGIALGGKLGEGVYGKVYQGTTSKGLKVAVKFMKHDSPENGLNSSTIREIGLLRSMIGDDCCCHIIRLLGVSYAPVYGLALVLEFADYTLTDQMNHTKTAHTPQMVHKCVQDIATGLAYLHKKRILHRDLKPCNVLWVNTRTTWVIADFGLSRPQTDGAKTTEVQTVWYRAPEILMGSKTQDAAMDVWSLGAILYQLLAQMPPFHTRMMDKYAEKPLNMLRLIFAQLGCPTEETWPTVSGLPMYQHFTKMPQRAQEPLPVIGISLHLKILKGLLTLDPKTRVPATWVLEQLGSEESRKLSRGGVTVWKHPVEQSPMT
jgi:serine/threonine protein kinase